MVKVVLRDRTHDLVIGSKNISFAFKSVAGGREFMLMKKRRAWTAKDIRTLKKLAGKRTRAAKIARTLKRTEGATRQKAFSLDLSLETRGGAQRSQGLR
jgi:trimethylamine:corrinoid methyltransferase-like protein